MKLALKRTVSIATLCTIIISTIVLAGCNDDMGEALPNTTHNNAPTQDVQESNNTTDNATHNTTDNTTVIWKIYSPDFISIWQEPLNRLLVEKGASYTVRIEYCEANGENKESYADILEEMRQNGEPADVIAIPDTIYPIVSDRGLLMPLDDFLMSEQGAKIVNALPTRDLARSKYNGITYGISAHIRTIGAIAYNKEYLDKYDIDVEELSQDIFENEAILQLIKSGEGGSIAPYAYNDNVLDSLGMWRSLLLSPIDTGECLVHTQQGETVNVFTMPQLREALFRIKSFKDNELISFVSENGYKPFFATDVFVHREDVFESTFTYSVAGQSVTVDTVVIPNMKRPQIAPLWGDAQTGIASWSKNQDNALDFLTRLYTDPDIANLIQYGVEGKEHTLRDGIASYLPGNILWVFGENYTNTFITHPQNDTAVNKMEFQIKYYEECESFVPDGFRFDPEPVTAEIGAVNAVYYANIDTYEISDTVKNLFTVNVPDIDAAILEINAMLKAAGVDAIIEEFDRQLADWRTRHGD